MPAASAPLGSRAVSDQRGRGDERQEPVRARSPGTARSMAANRTRPTVTIPQNAVRAIDAVVDDAPMSVVMKTVAQLPLIVSTIPYSRANAANSQNRDGSGGRLAAGASSVAAVGVRPRSGKPRLDDDQRGEEHRDDRRQSPPRSRVRGRPRPAPARAPCPARAAR